MSDERKFELSIIKTAKDINYDKPKYENNLVEKEEYDKIDTVLSEAVAITNAGTTLVSENALPELFSENKNDTRFIVDNEISEEAKVSIGGTKYVKSGAVIEKTHTRSEEHPDAMKRAKNRYSEQSLINISNSDAVKIQKANFEDYARKEERRLSKKRKNEHKIKSDEVTGEPLEGNGEFHHIDKKSIYTDPVKRLNPDSGVIVNKKTHQELHRDNVNNKEKFNNYIEKRKNMD